MQKREIGTKKVAREGPMIYCFNRLLLLLTNNQPVKVVFVGGRCTERIVK